MDRLGGHLKPKGRLPAERAGMIAVACRRIPGHSVRRISLWRAGALASAPTGSTVLGQGVDGAGNNNNEHKNHKNSMNNLNQF